MIFPVCRDGSACDDPVMYFGTVKSMFEKENFRFDEMKLKADGFKFDFRSNGFDGAKNPFEALTARAGDLNLVRN